MIASWGLQLLGLLKPPSMIMPVGLEIPLNARVLGYTAGLSVLGWPDGQARGTPRLTS